MNDQLKSFGQVATGLSRNPLGIIALFIVLVYGFASLVTAFGGGLSTTERLPLIYFLIVFPILVLAVFTWLVSKHSGKLFAPRDFKNEDNYVKMPAPDRRSYARFAVPSERHSKKRPNPPGARIVVTTNRQSITKTFADYGSQLECPASTNSPARSLMIRVRFGSAITD
jgi:hypothetical protein